MLLFTLSRIKVRDTKTTLTIHEVVNSDAGQYTVRVKNDLGSDLTRAGLTISSKWIQTIIQKVGNNFDIFCKSCLKLSKTRVIASIWGICNMTTEVYDSIEGTYVSLPQLIVDGNSG